MSSREEFEAWASKQKLGLTYGDCGYVFSSTEMAWRAWRAMEAKCAALAAENASIKFYLRNGPVILKGGELAAAHQFAPETPATDAFLSEVRASAIPEGHTLVPQQMFLSAEAMEGICFHCGDGGFAFGEFTDGILFVGAIDDSDGQKIHGLHIATADYPEEGYATVCEFLPVTPQGAAK